jgi:hypothetical protein
MKRNEPCSHLRPSYDRLELAHYITQDPDTGEISWEPTAIEDELIRLGLIAQNAKQPCTRRRAEDPDT